MGTSRIETVWLQTPMHLPDVTHPCSTCAHLRTVTRWKTRSRASHQDASGTLTPSQMRSKTALSKARETPPVCVWNNAATPKIRIRSRNERTNLFRRTQKAESHTRILMVAISQTPCSDKWPQKKRVANDSKKSHQMETTTIVPNRAQHEEHRNRTDHVEGCPHAHGELCMVPWETTTNQNGWQPTSRLCTTTDCKHADTHLRQWINFSIIVPHMCANRNGATHHATTTDLKRRDCVKNWANWKSTPFRPHDQAHKEDRP